MLNKSHPVRRYMVNGGKIKKKKCILTLMLRSLTLAIDTRYNLVTTFPQ